MHVSVQKKSIALFNIVITLAASNVAGGWRGGRTPPFFIKEKQHGFSRPRKNLQTLSS